MGRQEESGVTIIGHQRATSSDVIVLYLDYINANTLAVILYHSFPNVTIWGNQVKSTQDLSVLLLYNCMIICISKSKV